MIKLKADNFVWTDDEVQLLLEVTNDYKVSKAARVKVLVVVDNNLERFSVLLL